MQKSFEQWMDFLYGPIFKVIGFFYRIYTANRARAENIKANHMVSALIKFMTLSLLLGWILIWYLADNTNQSSLIEDVKQSIGWQDTRPDQ